MAMILRPKSLKSTLDNSPFEMELQTADDESGDGEEIPEPTVAEAENGENNEIAQPAPRRRQRSSRGSIPVRFQAKAPN